MIRYSMHEENRRAWNAATIAHNSHKADQARFFREGGSTLFPEELLLLGNIEGKNLLHLQCNSGQDTLSLAKHGATVTGVDISDRAIEFACQLSAESGIPATFHRADIYEWFTEATQQSSQYDVVFSSYGAVCWLSDIQAWAKGIWQVLKPGGKFVLVEFHPFTMTMDGDWQFSFSYFNGRQGKLVDEGLGDYVAWSGEALAPSGYLEGIRDFENPHHTHEFDWGLGEVVSALAEAGLILKTLREYPYSNGCKLFKNMRELPGKRMVQPDDMPELPLMYGLAVHKP